MAEHLTRGTRSRFRSLPGLREECLARGSSERATLGLGHQGDCDSCKKMAYLLFYKCATDKGSGTRKLIAFISCVAFE